MEIGFEDFGGLLIDNVVIKTSSLKTPLFVLSFFCNNQFGGFKYLALFLEDLSMYQYDNRSYEEIMKIFLETVNQIQVIKLSMFNAATHIPINSSVIPATNLTQFSNEKHMEVDG